MASRVSAVVTWNDLSKYFTGAWKTDRDYDGMDATYHGYISLRIEQKEAQFGYKVEAVEDSSDSDEGVSDDPAKAISDFIFGPIPGGETLGLAAFGPDRMAYLFRVMAAGVENGRISYPILRKTLRRAMLLPDQIHTPVRVADAGGVQESELFVLKNQMEKKGWRVKESGPDDRPTLQVDISDIYEATIDVEGVMWNFSFEFEGHPDLTEEGITDDPIREFQTWYRTDEFKEAQEERDEASKPGGDKKTEPSPESMEKTIPAESGPGNTEKTMPAQEA